MSADAVLLRGESERASSRERVRAFVGAKVLRVLSLPHILSDKNHSSPPPSARDLVALVAAYQGPCAWFLFVAAVGFAVGCTAYTYIYIIYICIHMYVYNIYVDIYIFICTYMYSSMYVYARRC